MNSDLCNETFSNELFKSVFDDAEDGMWILHDTKLLVCNKTAADQLGYRDPEELQNIHPAEISPNRQIDGRWSTEKAYEMVTIAQRKGHHKFIWQHVRKNGSEISLEVSLNIVRYKNIWPLHVVWRNIVEEAPDPRNRISHREQECLIWTALGNTSAQIAEILGLSEQTVNNYLTSATRKLHANNRTQAVALAYEKGLLKSPNMCMAEATTH